jgi:tetratricopeptide (TPR) repeat protein
VINKELGVPDDFVAESIFDKRFVRDEHALENPAGGAAVVIESDDFAIVGVVEPESHIDSAAAFVVEGSEAIAVEVSGDPFKTEVESIRFYIENGYNDLAEKAVDELRQKFGDRPEIVELEALLDSPQGIAADVIAEGNTSSSSAFDLEDLRSELGLIDSEPANDGDYETLYQTAVAYKEMGLHEQAIKEFQDAADLVSPNDGTRRFFNCANLLGHCFMEMGKPNLAVKWHQRSLESYDINDDERRGVWYELGIAYEADGDTASAAKYFEQVYAENIDFRDIGDRMRNLSAVAL